MSREPVSKELQVKIKLEAPTTESEGQRSEEIHLASDVEEDSASLQVEVISEEQQAIARHPSHENIMKMAEVA